MHSLQKLANDNLFDLDIFIENIELSTYSSNCTYLGVPLEFIEYYSDAELFKRGKRADIFKIGSDFYKIEVYDTSYESPYSYIRFEDFKLVSKKKIEIDAWVEV